MSTHPRCPGGLAHPHWQCVDWQLGTDDLEFSDELDSSHSGALRLWPIPNSVRTLPGLSPSSLLYLPFFLPFFPSQGPDSGISSFFSYPSPGSSSCRGGIRCTKKKKITLVPHSADLAVPSSVTVLCTSPAPGPVPGT